MFRARSSAPQLPNLFWPQHPLRAVRRDPQVMVFNCNGATRARTPTTFGETIDGCLRTTAPFVKR